MVQLSEHPTVKQFYENGPSRITSTAAVKLDVEQLRRICRKAGADDVGFVEIDRPRAAATIHEIRRNNHVGADVYYFPSQQRV